MKYGALVWMGFLVVAGCKGKQSATGSADTNAAAVQADGSVILALEDDPMPEGAVLEENFLMEMKDGAMTITLPDREMKGTMTLKQTHEAKQEGLAGGKRRVTLLEEKKTEQVTMMGNAQPPKVTVDPLVGMTTIAEKGADGTWTVVLEAGEPTPEMTEALKKESGKMAQNMDKRIYGTVPRKPGDEWEVVGDDLLGMEGSKGTMKVRFEGMEQYAGMRCAKLTGTLDVSGAPPGADGMVMSMSGDFTVFRSVEHRVDLSNVLKGKMKLAGEMEPQPGMKMKMKMEGTMEMTGDTKLTVPE